MEQLLLQKSQNMCTIIEQIHPSQTIHTPSTICCTSDFKCSSLRPGFYSPHQFKSCCLIINLDKIIMKYTKLVHSSPQDKSHSHSLSFTNSMLLASQESFFLERPASDKHTNCESWQHIYETAEKNLHNNKLKDPWELWATTPSQLKCTPNLKIWRSKILQIQFLQILLQFRLQMLYSRMQKLFKCGLASIKRLHWQTLGCCSTNQVPKLCIKISQPGFIKGKLVKCFWSLVSSFQSPIKPSFSFLFLFS
jgi:hypothetical protein